MKWVARVVILIVAVYVTWFSVVLTAMYRGPEPFGQFMSRIPEVLVWRGLPAARMWLWARKGSLQPGDTAPDFTLSTHNHQDRVTLSSHRGRQPVVLVFGSYT